MVLRLGLRGHRSCTPQCEVVPCLLFKALVRAPRLRTLGLLILPHEYDTEFLGVTVIPALLSANAKVELFPKLKVLELEGHHINPYDLLTFLQPICKKLRRLDLRYIRYQKSLWADSIEYPEIEESHTTSAVWYCMLKQICADAELGWYKVYDGASWRDREFDRRFPISRLLRRRVRHSHGRFTRTLFYFLIKLITLSILKLQS